MQNVSDVINSVKATLYERISNPLLSSFLVSWVIWNYKFILVFLSSSMNTIEKIDYIQKVLFPLNWHPLFSSDNTWSILFLLIGPLVTTGLYLYVIYPKMGKKVYEDHKEHIRQYEEIKVKIEGKTSMSEEDVIVMKSQLRTIKGIYSKQLDDKDAQIEQLKQDLKSVTIDAAKARNQLSELQAENLSSNDYIDDETSNENMKSSDEVLSDQMLSILEFVAHEAPVQEKIILDKSKTSRVMTEYNIGELENKGMLEYDVGNDGSYYSLTHRGREALIQSGRIS